MEKDKLEKTKTVAKPTDSVSIANGVKYTIDATGKSVGRIASQAATLLMGKNESDFTRHKLPKVSVEITGINKLSISDKKLTQKIYHHYSGYPSGLKVTPLKKLVETKSLKEVLRRAIYGMLPKNKLRPQMIKKLTLTE